MKQNPPQRHHYIPEFYLKRWGQVDGRICQSARYYGKVRQRFLHPAATGYVDKLYSLKGFPKEHAEIIETNFFSPIDSLAADALSLMEEQGNTAPWNTKLRSAWSRFLFSLLMRCPEDVTIFRDTWEKHLLKDRDDEWETKYKETRKDTDPETFLEYLKNRSAATNELSAMQAYIEMINNVNIGQKLNDMHWYVLETNNAVYSLLTSDRPVIMTNGWLIPGGHIAMPLGPKRLFIAAPDIKTIKNIISLPVNEIVKESNRQVTDYAKRYVYSCDRTQLPFIEKRISSKSRQRLIETTALRQFSE